MGNSLSENNVARARGGDRVSLYLMVFQLFVSCGAVIVATLKACSACGGGSSLHLAIAILGTIGYACLLVLAWNRHDRWVHLGVVIALGVHSGLGLAMVAQGYLCPLCLLACIGALLLGLRVCISRKWVMSIPLGVTTLSFGIIAFSLGRSMMAETYPAPRRSPGIFSSQERSSATLHVVVRPGCPYCEEFKKEFAPKIAGDFPNMKVAYEAADLPPWRDLITRVPTILIEHGSRSELLFEGLPYRYDNLRWVLSKSLSGNKNGAVE